MIDVARKQTGMTRKERALHILEQTMDSLNSRYSANEIEMQDLAYDIRVACNTIEEWWSEE